MPHSFFIEPSHTHSQVGLCFVHGLLVFIVNFIGIQFEIMAKYTNTQIWRMEGPRTIFRIESSPCIWHLLYILQTHNWPIRLFGSFFCRTVRVSTIALCTLVNVQCFSYSLVERIRKRCSAAFIPSTRRALSILIKRSNSAPTVQTYIYIYSIFALPNGRSITSFHNV